MPDTIRRGRPVREHRTTPKPEQSRGTAMACRLYSLILYKRDLSALSAVHSIERKSYKSRTRIQHRP